MKDWDPALNGYDVEFSLFLGHWVLLAPTTEWMEEEEEELVEGGGSQFPVPWSLCGHLGQLQPPAFHPEAFSIPELTVN